MTLRPRKSEAFFDIVWRQFCKNGPSLVALYLLAPLFLIAIFAPVLASDQPLVFRQGDSAIYPWFRALFTADNLVDQLFNMALVGFFPWLFLGLVTNAILKRRNVTGPYRMLTVAAEFLLVTGTLSVIFWLPGIAIGNKYRDRTFPVEEFNSGGKSSGIYVLIPFGPTEQDRDAYFKPPLYRKSYEKRRDTNDGLMHWLGTDDNGRDVLVRMIYGTRVSLTIGFLAVGIYLAIGVIVGAIAGYFGGWVDMLASRVIEIVLLFPSFFLILTLVAMFGPSVLIIMFVIGITGWPTVARLIRGEVLKQRGLDYVQAARAIGVSHLRVLFRHILPNALSPALVAAPFGIANAIITEAGLSLLGFGVQPPAPTWGTLLRLGNGNYHNWWLIVVPSVMIFFTVTVFNQVGSGLRDAMDPRLRA